MKLNNWILRSSSSSPSSSSSSFSPLASSKSRPVKVGRPRCSAPKRRRRSAAAHFGAPDSAQCGGGGGSRSESGGLEEGGIDAGGGGGCEVDGGCCGCSGAGKWPSGVVNDVNNTFYSKDSAKIVVFVKNANNDVISLSGFGIRRVRDRKRDGVGRGGGQRAIEEGCGGGGVKGGLLQNSIWLAVLLGIICAQSARGKWIYPHLLSPPR